ncbi:MAG: site-specific integrase, partial [Phycisphaerae bacterium]
MASIYRRKQGGYYYITYQVRPGQRRTVKGSKDRAATEALARKLESDAMLREHGIIDPKAEKLATNGARPIETHVDDFDNTLLGRSVTDKHRKATLSYIRKVIEACGFATPADIDASAVAAHVADLKRKKHGLRSINARLTAFKAFTRWMVRTERLRADPMVSVSKLNARTERRHARRALTDDEIRRLLEAAQKGRKVRGLTGPERAVLYRLALETGLRASELGSLRPRSFDLTDLDRATVTVEAACSKHRREDVLPLRPDMALAMAEFIGDRDRDEVLFRMPDKPAAMIRKDLEAADIPYRDASDRVADFHALRHTFITRLARSGVAPAVAK